MTKIRLTKQKRIIEEELDKFDSFFTGNELYEKVKKIDKNIGIATVYRFLKDLKDKNEIHSYICDRKTIYSLKNTNHCHFICKNCKKTKHIDIKDINFLKNNISEDICHFQIDIHGLCENCRKKH